MHERSKRRKLQTPIFLNLHAFFLTGELFRLLFAVGHRADAFWLRNMRFVHRATREEQRPFFCNQSDGNHA